MCDRPVPPVKAQFLATDKAGHPVVFQAGGNALRFGGHPDCKTTMADDLIMEHEEALADPVPKLQVAERYPKQDCPTLHDMFVIEDQLVNLKRTYRIYHEEGCS